MENEQKAAFTRKPINRKDIMQDNDFQSARGFVVEKIAELTPQEYAVFSEELYEYYRFLYEERDAMYCDGEGNYHCILVTTLERKEGILVETEGYAYPRYAAPVENCGKLDLKKAEKLETVSLSHEMPSEYWMGIPSQSEKNQQEKNQPER